MKLKAFLILLGTWLTLNPAFANKGDGIGVGSTCVILHKPEFSFSPVEAPRMRAWYASAVTFMNKGLSDSQASRKTNDYGEAESSLYEALLKALGAWHEDGTGVVPYVWDLMDQTLQTYYMLKSSDAGQFDEDRRRRVSMLSSQASFMSNASKMCVKALQSEAFLPPLPTTMPATQP